MDRVIHAWKDAGLLVPNPNLKIAMHMFLVAKPNMKCVPKNCIRIIESMSFGFSQIRGNEKGEQAIQRTMGRETEEVVIE